MRDLLKVFLHYIMLFRNIAIKNAGILREKLAGLMNLCYNTEKSMEDIP